MFMLNNKESLHITPSGSWVGEENIMERAESAWDDLCR